MEAERQAGDISLNKIAKVLKLKKKKQREGQQRQ